MRVSASSPLPVIAQLSLLELFRNAKRAFGLTSTTEIFIDCAKIPLRPSACAYWPEPYPNVVWKVIWETKHAKTIDYIRDMLNWIT